MTFSPSLESTRNLPESETAALKDVVIRWARSTARIEEKALHENLRIEKAERIPVFDLTLNTLLETRTGPDEIVRPVTESSSPVSAPVPRERVELWAAPSQPPKEFVEQTGTFPIESSFGLRDCPACLRSGVATCGTCAGGGKVTCSNCRGAGKTECLQCKGLSKVNCLKCGGRGLAHGVTLMVKASDACDACQGLGKIPCAQCSHGQMVCSHCDGGGRRPCAVCRADGRVPCGACGSKGQILWGWGFRSEFKPVRSASAAPAAPAPAAIWQKALAHKKPAGAPLVLSEPLGEEALAASGLGQAVQAALRESAAKIKPMLSGSTRVARQELAVQRAYILRITGVFYEQPFVYWFLPESKEIVPEKNPLQNLVQTTTEEAQRALDAEDWVSAARLANRALSFDHTNEDARAVLRSLKRKVLLESVGATLVAGLAVSAAVGGYIHYGLTGLHKVGPLAAAVGSILGLSILCGMFWPLIIMRRPRRRRLVLGSAMFYSFGVLSVFVAGMVFVADWNGVKAADARALGEEFREKFPNGVGDVYWEPDLRALEDLSAKYAQTEADLTLVSQGLEKQKRLLAEKQGLERDLKTKLAEVLRPDNGLLSDQRRALVKELRDFYELRGIDVTAASAALKDLDRQVQIAQKEPVSRISIIDNRKTKKAEKQRKEVKKAKKKKR
jgi:hypothetical protein